MSVEGPPLGEKEAREPTEGKAPWDSAPWGLGSNEHRRCCPIHTVRWKANDTSQHCSEQRVYACESHCNPLCKSVRRTVGLLGAGSPHAYPCGDDIV